jgi:hypothetical protein
MRLRNFADSTGQVTTRRAVRGARKEAGSDPEGREICPAKLNSRAAYFGLKEPHRLEDCSDYR